MPSIEMLPSADEALAAALTDLVNRVYAVAERGLWAEGAARTTVADVAGLVAAGEIAVARAGDGADGSDGADGPVVGCVRVRGLDDERGELGMLVADPARRGEGIGQDLVAFAEDRCRRQGRAVMQLELLVPREWVHPEKAFLDAWYRRLGYRPARTGTIDEAHPQLAPLLATPCDVVTYRKALTPG